MDAEVSLNRNRVRRASAMTAVASFALVILAACGGPGEVAHEDVTRVPIMSDAAAQATRDAASAPATPEGEGEAPTTADAPAAAEGEAPAAAMTVEVVSYDIYFEPAELTIPANTDVTVVLPNNGAAPHNFSVDEFGIDVDIAPGATEETVINAPAGEYEFYCAVPGHKEAGMVGTLIVSEDAVAAPAGAPAADAEASPVAPADAAPGAATPEGAAPEATPEQEAATPAGGTPVAATDEQAAGEVAAEAVEVVSFDIYFEPEELSIPADTDVIVSRRNDGAARHNVSIDELGIDVDIAPGATEEVVINAPAGEYEYYCNVPGHKQAGMVGTLTVG